MKSVAVVTATTCRETLRQTCESVAAQTYPVKHYVFFDGVYHKETADMVRSFNGIVLALPVQTGSGGMMNGGILAASAYLVQENFICWLDDDNWMDANHVETMVEAKGDKPYAWSLRKLFTEDGKFYADDDCESLGPHSGFIDANCYLMDRSLAVQLAPAWYHTTGELMVGDRHVYATLHHNKVEGAGTGRYTLNYRLNTKRDLRAFFYERNLKTRGQFPDGFPWSKP